MLRRIKQENLVWVGELIKGDEARLVWDGSKLELFTDLLPNTFTIAINRKHFEHTANKVFTGRKLAFFGRLLAKITPEGQEQLVFIVYDAQVDDKYLDMDQLINTCLCFGLNLIHFSACIPCDGNFAYHLQQPSKLAEWMGLVAPKYGIFVKPMRELENEKGRRIVLEILREPEAEKPVEINTDTQQEFEAAVGHSPKQKHGKGKKK